MKGIGTFGVAIAVTVMLGAHPSFADDPKFEYADRSAQPGAMIRDATGIEFSTLWIVDFKNQLWFCAGRAPLASAGSEWRAGEASCRRAIITE
ncbi:MAG TPA: hypothetical protein QF804_05195 [Rhodospirillales bacterium]|jgi:hypothetical protein|nr:hypothetical protein [Rhodospirillales bacterium]HJO69059.1 hypothetical protein [Rhodospirillales bacterium]